MVMFLPGRAVVDWRVTDQNTGWQVGQLVGFVEDHDVSFRDQFANPLSFTTISARKR